MVVGKLVGRVSSRGTTLTQSIPPHRPIHPIHTHPQSKFQAAVSGRLEELERLKAEVGALDQVFQTDTDYEHASYKVGWLVVCVLGDGIGTTAAGAHIGTRQTMCITANRHTLKTNIKHN